MNRFMSSTVRRARRPRGRLPKDTAAGAARTSWGSAQPRRQTRGQLPPGVSRSKYSQSKEPVAAGR